MPISLGSISSVTTGIPVFFLASARYLNPSSPSPWNAYGDVLGLKAPPLRNLAPAFFTLFAASNRSFLVSILHGPAIIYYRRPTDRLGAAAIHQHQPPVAANATL